MLNVGDRLWIGGGHGPQPEWLCGGDGYEGTIRRFLPGPSQGFAVVELDESIEVKGLIGSWLILSLRHTGARWKESETVHVVLCASEPRAMVSHKGPGVSWVESHAQYRRL